MKSSTVRFRERLRVAIARHHAGDLSGAIGAYSALLNESPGHPDVLHMMAVARLQAGEARVAVELFDLALQSAVDPTPIYSNRAAALLKLGDFGSARESARRAIGRGQGSAGAWLNLGLAESGLGNRVAAVDAMLEVLRITPGNTRAFLEAVVALVDANRAEEALRVVKDHGATVNPNEHRPIWVEAIERAAGHGFLEVAERIYLIAIAARPDFDDMTAAWARALLDQNRVVAALSLVNERLEKGIVHSGLLLVQASAYQDLGEIERSLASYETLEHHFPHWAEAHSNRLIVLQHDVTASNEEIFEAHREWARRHGPKRPAARPAPRHDRGRLRVGWVSPRFSHGPVGMFFVGVARELARQEFEHVFYHDGPRTDSVSREFRQSADEWRVTGDLGADQFCKQVRDDELDVIVEMAGHGPGNRLLALSSRPAPIQISWLDYFHSTGTDWIDFVLTDAELVPPGEERWFSERVRRLPLGRLCYTPPQWNLPVERRDDEGIVLGCFNRPAKLNDRVFEVWAEILERLPQATLFLRSFKFVDTATRVRFLERAAASGLDERRMRLAGPADYHEVLQSYGDVDIALDPFPFSGCATTCDALWMGVPVVTMAGTTAAGRQSAALLTQLGIPEWITSNREEYVRKVVELAGKVEERNRWRPSLREMMRERLCDAQAFASSLCATVREIHQEIL